MSDRELVGKCGAPGSSEGLLVPATVAAPSDRACMLFPAPFDMLFHALGAQQ